MQVGVTFTLWQLLLALRLQLGSWEVFAICVTGRSSQWVLATKCLYILHYDFFFIISPHLDSKVLQGRAVIFLLVLLSPVIRAGAWPNVWQIC